MEGGIAWSRAGPVATGTLMAGLAAAMEPKITNWLPNSGGEKMGIRDLKENLNINQCLILFFFQFLVCSSHNIIITISDSNVWASTLAADLAQTALLKRKGQTYVGPDGYFNNTLCPTEFMLRISNQGMPYFDIHGKKYFF